MNGIENSTRFGAGGGWQQRGVGSVCHQIEIGSRGKRKRIPSENDISADAAHGMAADGATRGDGNGGKTNLRVARANDVSTVRPTGAITGGILQSLRLYLRGSGTSPVCLRHVLKMITICIYMCTYTWVVCTLGL